MKIFHMPGRFIVTLIAAGLPLCAQEPKTVIEQKLQSEYAVTQATAAEDDIVTAGAILVLKKGSIIMASTTSPSLYQNFYRDGKITQNTIGKIDKGLSAFGHRMGSAGSTTNRTYVPGEKMWLTKIEVKDDGVVFTLLTDPINDTRYRATLRFVWAKGQVPPVDQVEKEVADVFSVQPADNSNTQQQSAQSAQPAAPSRPVPALASSKPADAAPEPIAPPPPPTDAPTQTISLGQTTDQVVGILGQPQKIIKLSSKQIYAYKDMKITFVGGKVSDVQ